jgi:hypothetical protein
VPRRWGCILLLAGALTWCGGSGSSDKSMPTATPPAAQATPQGLDVDAIAKARADFATACKAREAGDSSLTDLRRAVSTLLDSLKANPDTPFRTSPNLPPGSMRQRIRALAVALRTHCGGGAVKKLRKRLLRAATSDAS